MRLGFFPAGDYSAAMPITTDRYLVNLPDVCGGETLVDGTRVGAA